MTKLFGYIFFITGALIAALLLIPLEFFFISVIVILIALHSLEKELTNESKKNREYSLTE